ncbi:MAG TPA: MaoC family dehydratase, partial [Clostridia bacterium]|nr:MaoC family dehydratase [Clostridia bacterium]
GKTMSELRLGDRAETVNHVTEETGVKFADVSNDNNPVHLDEAYASATPFKGRIAHGMLLAAYISAVLGNDLPGPGSIYVNQTLSFKAPVRYGDTITTTVEVVELIPERNRSKFKTTCTNQNGLIVLEGEATILPPKE